MSASDGSSDFPAPFALPLRWLRAFTPVTYFSKLPGLNALAALLQRKWLWESPCIKTLNNKP